MKPVQLKKTERDPMEMALSLDVVMDNVLSHLKIRDLLSCRFVSKFWNTAASSVLRRRSTMMKNILEENQLIELQECMEKSWDFPFAGLKFDKPWVFDLARAVEFFQSYGDRFTHLRLDTGWEGRLRDMVPFIDHLPRLSILEVDWPTTCFDKLYYYTNGKECDKILKLPSVRTIRISADVGYGSGSRALLEILNAASPSLRIECLETTSGILETLISSGKLGAVYVMKINGRNLHRKFELEMDQFLSTESLSLTKLDFKVGEFLSLNGLQKILFSSPHTLKELHLEGINLSDLPWNEFPVFAKLTTLSLCNIIDFRHESLFRGHNFPALKEFKLNVKYYKDNANAGSIFCRGLCIVPSVITIELEGYADGDAMKGLAQIFPNVVDIRLNYSDYSEAMPREDSRGSNLFDMWNVREFKCLKTLRIWNYPILWPSENYINMDSFLTGIPVGICRKLLKQKQVIPNIMDSPFSKVFNEVLRDNQSILHLKNLQELVVCVVADYGFGQLPEDAPFMSMVSMWYALDMMPNLRTRFVYDDYWSRLDSRELDDAVPPALDNAFKHVKPYVKLERFFR